MLPARLTFIELTMRDIFKMFEELGVPAHVVFSTTVTITIFVVGISLTRLQEWYSKRRHLRSIRKVVFVYLRSIATPLMSHSVYLRDSAVRMADPNTRDYFFQEDGVRRNYLASFSQTELFNALVYGFRKKKSDRIEYFNVIMSTLDHIECNRALALLHFQQMVKKFDDNLVDWNAAVEPLIRKFEQWLGELLRAKRTLDDDCFLLKINDIVKKWQAMARPNDLTTIMENIVKPIHSIAASHTPDPRAIELLSYTTKACVVFESRLNLAQLMSSHFSDQSALYDAINESLQRILNIYGLQTTS